MATGNYFGYFEVEVRELRGTGIEGEMMDQGNKRVVRVDDAVADALLEGITTDENEAVKKVSQDIRAAIVEVAGARKKYDLAERWADATRSMTAEQMERALEVLEAR